MSERLKDFAGKVKETISTTAHFVGDLNGDGKIDIEDAKIAAEWAKRHACEIGEEAAKVGKKAMRSDMVKDAAAGAIVGAAIATPVPGIGTLTGAAIGASLGVYKNINKREAGSTQSKNTEEKFIDVHAELIKFDELRQKGIITESEFENQKSKLLKST